MLLCRVVFKTKQKMIHFKRLTYVYSKINYTLFLERLFIIFCLIQCLLFLDTIQLFHEFFFFFCQEQCSFPFERSWHRRKLLCLRDERFRLSSALKTYTFIEPVAIHGVLLSDSLKASRCIFLFVRTSTL